MFTKDFKKITKKDVAICGGKGASLGEMTAAKIPVPPGLVVLASAFDRFLEETGLSGAVAAKLKTVRYDDVNSIDKVSGEIHDLILKSKMPADIAKEILTDFKKLNAEFVAVRSSATAEDSAAASWAGELETYLNTTEKSLLENVKKCWASLFTPRAICYRQEKGLLDSKVSVAVVIQKMIDSEVSGIAFTVHPVTEDKNQMIIEAGFGLGEAIVSGSITPDSYVLDKRDLSLTDINVAVQEKEMVKDLKKRTKWQKVLKTKQERQKLSNKEIVVLAKICLGIEKHYKFPCDIEWAFDKNKFYIVQSRPITTL